MINEQQRSDDGTTGIQDSDAPTHPVPSQDGSDQSYVPGTDIALSAETQPDDPPTTRPLIDDPYADDLDEESLAAELASIDRETDRRSGSAEHWSPDLSWTQPDSITRSAVPNAGVDETPFSAVPYEAPSLAESVRQSGLAWSAGIAFFGSVLFFLFLGWIIDLLLGSSPWGLVGGIVFGGLIGFVQFFRITSQIFPSSKSSEKVNPLMSSRDETHE
jgi:F0F1-type ATP synthase assembly protein I